VTVRSLVRTYSIALAGLAVAVLLRAAIDPLLGDHLPFVTLYGSVALAVWMGGWLPATVTALLGFVAVNVAFMGPRGSLGFDQARDVVGFFAYLLSVASIVVLGELARSAQRRAEAGRERLEQELAIRRRSEEAARISEARLHVATSAADLFTWDADLLTRTIRWSDNTADVVGCRPEELPRELEHATFFMAPDDAERVRASWRDGMSGSQELFNDEFRGAVGGSFGPRPRHFLGRARVERDANGRVLRMIGATQDITRLRESEARQTLLLELNDALRPLTDPIAMQHTATGLIGAHLRAGRVSFCRIVDDETGEFLPGYEDGVPPLLGRLPLRLFGEALLESYRRGETVTCDDVDRAPFFTPAERDGLRDARIAAFIGVMLMRSGRWVAAFCVHQAAPRAWTTIEIELVREIAERTWSAIERVQAEHALREADRRKDEFLATLAHELRNPLAPIRNAAGVLRTGTADRADQTSGWVIIERQIAHMSHLLDDLLDVNRISRGKIVLRRRHVALAEVVQVAVETSRPLIERGGHQLLVELPESPVILDADPVRLAQVFSNLLNNAANYTPDGGHVRLVARVEGDQVSVSVRDTGIGIAPEMLPQVFEIFSQVEPARERARSGLGIGLSLVRGLTALHGGTVEARSEGAGAGSEFVVRLPLATGATAAGATPEAQDGNAPIAPMRLLIVDDLPDAADSLAMLLQTKGHEVRVAYNGEDAIAASAEFRPDVVLLDIGMPDMNGYEVCRRIRAGQDGNGMALVALTGWGQEEDRRRSELAGFDAHLVKPVDPDALLGWLATRTPSPEAATES